jgi:hypothetical protein
MHCGECGIIIALHCLCRHTESGAMLMLGEEEFRPVNHRCWDIEQRVTDMNTDNIDVQIISNTPILFQYHRPVAEVGEGISLSFLDLYVTHLFY